MASLIIFLAVLALLGYVIERNHRRRRPGRWSGSVNYEDRDEARVAADLRGLSPAGEEGPVRTAIPRTHFVPARRH